MTATVQQANTPTQEYCSDSLLQSLEELQAENERLRTEVAALQADNRDLRYEVRCWRGG